jgi:hypothetical protein
MDRVRHYTDGIERGEARMTSYDTHRPMGDYLDAVQDMGLLVERIAEPMPNDAYVALLPEART